MKATLGWASMFVMLLAGCNGTHSVSSPPGAERALHWDGADWRICEKQGCSMPTRKTVAINTLPAPVITKPIKPVATPAAQAKSILTIHFANGSSKVAAGEREKLSRWMAKNGKDKPVWLFGRTDETGRQAYNDRLANRRAVSVAEVLKDLGYTGRIEIGSAGRCCYLGGQPSPEDRARNRRVELEFSITDKE